MSNVIIENDPRSRLYPLCNDAFTPFYHQGRVWSSMTQYLCYSVKPNASIAKEYRPIRMINHLMPPIRLMYDVEGCIQVYEFPQIDTNVFLAAFVKKCEMNDRVTELLLATGQHQIVYEQFGVSFGRYMMSVRDRINREGSVSSTSLSPADTWTLSDDAEKVFVSVIEITRRIMKTEGCSWLRIGMIEDAIYTMTKVPINEVVWWIRNVPWSTVFRDMPGFVSLVEGRRETFRFSLTCVSMTTEQMALALALPFWCESNADMMQKVLQVDANTCPLWFIKVKRSYRKHALFEEKKKVYSRVSIVDGRVLIFGGVPKDIGVGKITEKKVWYVRSPMKPDPSCTDCGDGLFMYSKEPAGEQSICKKERSILCAHSELSSVLPYVYRSLSASDRRTIAMLIWLSRRLHILIHDSCVLKALNKVNVSLKRPTPPSVADTFENIQSSESMIKDDPTIKCDSPDPTKDTSNSTTVKNVHDVHPSVHDTDEMIVKEPTVAPKELTVDCTQLDIDEGNSEILNEALKPENLMRAQTLRRRDLTKVFCKLYNMRPVVEPGCFDLSCFSATLIPLKRKAVMWLSAWCRAVCDEISMVDDVDLAVSSTIEESYNSDTNIHHEYSAKVERCLSRLTTFIPSSYIKAFLGVSPSELQNAMATEESLSWRVTRIGQ